LKWIPIADRHRTLILLVYAVVLIAIALGLYWFRPMVVSGSSMYPTLQDNDRILVDPFDARTDQLRRGDVVVFYPPGEDRRLMVKRVIGLPGDTVAIIQGRVYLNGHLLQEPYTNHREESHETIPAFVIPPDSVFVLGDNRLVSADSREWGAIPLDRIYGTLSYRFSTGNPPD